MAKTCLKCGRGNEKDKDITLYEVSIGNRNSEWEAEFLRHLGIQDLSDKEKDVYICSNHLPEGFQMKNSVLRLKEKNVFPIDTDENFGNHIEVIPEVMYYKSDVDSTEVIDSDTNDGKDLVPLEPLVEYMNVYEDVREEEQNSSHMTKIGVQREDGEVIIGAHYITEEHEEQGISVVNPQETNLGVEPVMPFFLTSSPMFTILNENNEVGETIILQIEETEEKKLPPPTPEALEELQQTLCLSMDGTPRTTYSCDICENSYGCLNCLKSHYETLHFHNSIRRYKCQFSHHVSKSLICPVCELTFESRNETMDHYIMHSVACDICGSGFDRQTHLTEHYKTVHNKGDYQVLYECEICKMTYQYPGTLTKHYRTFHKMTLCYVCKARFDTVSELQEHERVHQEKLNVLPFACSKCDKAFPKISDIAVHIRYSHKKESAGTAGVTSVQSQKTKNTEETPVQKKVKVKK